jgi:hypothetical protein
MRWKNHRIFKFLVGLETELNEVRWRIIRLSLHLVKSFSRVTKGRNKDECHAWDRSPDLGSIDANAVAVVNAHTTC